MANPTPQTSPNSLPGYSPNVQDFANNTHADWVDAFVKYWANRWASGDHQVPDGWVSALYGEPDPTDNIDPKTGIPMAGPRTMLAFARYAAAYKPGMDAQTDQVMPWTPPGANDYIEDPGTTAARVSQDNWDKTFAATKDNNERLLWQDAYKNDLSKYATEANMYGTDQAFASSVYGSQVSGRNSDNALAGSVYGTQGSMYNADEQNREAALGQAGTLSSALQGMYDTRTNNAIALKAAPSDFVQSEYATRALNGPIAEGVPGYKDVASLGDVIQRLINYKPNNPQPTAPVAAPMPAAPQPGTRPAAPVQTPFVPSAPPQAAAPVTPRPTTPQPTTATLTPKATLPAVARDAYGRLPVTIDPNVAADPSGYRWDSANQGWVDPAHGNAPYTPHAAHGGVMGAMQGFIAGDPQEDGQPNPEYIQMQPGGGASVTPLRDMIPRMAYGGTIEGSTDDQWGGNIPGGGYGGGIAGGNMLYPQGGNLGQAVKPLTMPGGSPGPAPYGGVSSGGGATAGGYPQPVSGPVSAPGTMVNQAAIPQVASSAAPGQSAIGNFPSDVPNELLNRPSASGAAPAPQVTLPSYNDAAYQNLPLLQYLQGLIGDQQFGTLATGTTPGAFGTRIPEAGATNYGRMLQLQKDPVAWGMAQSLYKSANRDIGQTLAKAKARAPLGQTVATSLVRT